MRENIDTHFPLTRDKIYYEDRRLNVALNLFKLENRNELVGIYSFLTTKSFAFERKDF